MPTSLKFTPLEEANPTLLFTPVRDLSRGQLIREGGKVRTATPEEEVERIKFTPVEGVKFTPLPLPIVKDESFIPEDLKEYIQGIAAPFKKPKLAEEQERVKPSGPEMRSIPEPSPLKQKVEEFIGPRGEVTPQESARALIEFEAGQQGLTSKEYKEQVGARTGVLERGGKDLASGAVGTAEGFLGYATRLTGSETLEDLRARLDEKATELLPADPGFLDNLAAGFGSTAVFFVPGVGIARGLQGVAGLTPRLALWLGSGAAAGMEAATEAGSIYQNLIEQGKTEAEAAKAADKAFWANAALITVTNRLGLFGEKGGQLKRRILSAVMEGPVQEGTQQIISNLSTGRPALEGYGEASAIGGIVGGVLGGAPVTRPVSPQEEVLPQEKGIKLFYGGGPDTSLEPALDRTTKILENLPKDKAIKRQSLEEQIKRPDVRKQEKELFREILDDPRYADQKVFHPEVLRREVLDRTFPLEVAVTEKWGTKGLDNLSIVDRAVIQELAAGGLDPTHIPQENIVDKAASHVWEGPFETPKELNHFDNDSYLIHTRVFDKGTRRSIVEVQSDLAQNFVGGETLTGVDTQSVERIQREIRMLSEMTYRGDVEGALNYFIEEGFFANDEAVVRARASPQNLTFAVADAMERLHDELMRLKAKKILFKLDPRWKRVEPTVGRLAIRQEHRLAAQQGKRILRLATPQTVAVVEGWHIPNPLRAGYDHRASRPTPLEDAIARTHTAEDFIPAHQGLFRKYEDYEKFVKKEYGAKEVADEHGSWLEWEVPPEASADPVMYLSSGLGFLGEHPVKNIKKILGYNINPEHPKELARYNNFIRQTSTLYQLGKMNKQIPGMSNYVRGVIDWNNSRTRWYRDVNDHLVEWSKLGKERSDRLGRFFLETTERSSLEKRRLTNEELVESMKKHHFDQEMVAVYEVFEKDFSEMLSQLEEVLFKDAAREFVDNPTELRNAASKITLEFKQLRNRNYFPLSRFGKFTITVKSNAVGEAFGRRHGVNDTVLFEAFDKENTRNERFAELRKKLPESQYRISADIMSDEEQTLQGLPGALLDTMRKKLSLTAEQEARLQKMRYELSPAQSFKRQLLQRKAIKGWSEDAMRSAANYFFHGANHMARIHYWDELQDSLKEMEEYKKSLKKQAVSDTSNTQGLIDHLNRHFDYIMNPKNEWAALRAASFTFYLGLVPKAAVVNLTQIPTILYPHLAAQYGDVKAMNEIQKAARDVTSGWRHPERSFTEEENMAIERGRDENFLEESLATEMADIAEGHILQRLLPSRKVGRMIRRAGYYSAFLFQTAEKFNRRTAFLAKLRLAREVEGLSFEEAYQAAKTTVDDTMFEYSKFNRPEFMRGAIKSNVFVFWQFKQNALYFATHDPGLLRYWLIMLVFAGVTGLPIVEDIIDIADYFATKYKEILGYKNPKVDLRRDAREFLVQVAEHPDLSFLPTEVKKDLPSLALNGISKHSFGLYHIGQISGIPIPDFDLSASVSMGRILPGVGPITSGGDFEQEFSQTAVEVGGAAFAIPFNTIKAATSEDPDVYKKWERAYPSSLKNVSKALRYAIRGEETSPSGATIAEFDLKKPEHWAEIFGQAAGFTPTRIHLAQEMSWMQKEQMLYYMTRQSTLLDSYAYAVFSRDPDAIKDVNEAIQKYNKSVPDGKLTITGKMKGLSLRGRKRRGAKEERGETSQRKYQRLGREVKELYPELEDR